MKEKRALVGCIVLAVVLAVSSPASGAGLRSRVADLEASVAALEGLIENLVLGPAEQLATVRGMVSWDGSILDGDGFTVTKKGEGKYFVAYDVATFSDRPTVLIQALGTVGLVANVDSETYIGFTVLTKTAAGVAANISFRFIALGPKTLSQ